MREKKSWKWETQELQQQLLPDLYFYILMISLNVWIKIVTSGVFRWILNV